MDRNISGFIGVDGTADPSSNDLVYIFSIDPINPINYLMTPPQRDCLFKIVGCKSSNLSVFYNCSIQNRGTCVI